MEKNKQIIVVCDGCNALIGFSRFKMTQTDAEAKKSYLIMSPFGAPRCKNCKNVEPYPDINLAHTVQIVDFKEGRNLYDLVDKQ